MDYREQQTCEIGLFAQACERMNDFARSIRQSSRFGTVITGADIRYYESGWRLEKWVEAELSADECLWACWWLELGPDPNGWTVSSHLSISHDEFSMDLGDRFAASLPQLDEQLVAAVEVLANALESNQQFANSVSDKLKPVR